MYLHACSCSSAVVVVIVAAALLGYLVCIAFVCTRSGIIVRVTQAVMTNMWQGIAGYAAGWSEPVAEGTCSQCYFWLVSRYCGWCKT
jgi:hypothetical protein